MRNNIPEDAADWRDKMAVGTPAHDPIIKQQVKTKAVR